MNKPADETIPELLPCPFCGAPASYSETRDNLTHFQLVCGNYNRVDRCNLQSVMRRDVPHNIADKTRKEITSAWNTRTPTAPALDREAVRRALEWFDDMLHTCKIELGLGFSGKDYEAEEIIRQLLQREGA